MQLARLLYPRAPERRSHGTNSCKSRGAAHRGGSSKAAILEAYVNRVPMGGNLYGVEAAARTYFGEPARDLDLAQASLLAAIPTIRRSPTRRRTGTPCARASATCSTAWPRSARSSRAQADAPSPKRCTCTGTTRGSPTRRTRSSFSIRTAPPPAGACARRSIDAAAFRAGADARRHRALHAYHVTDAAALVVDNRTGAVLAYVGSPDYFSDEALGRNDGVQALRQPGSSLKPFTYELALERGTILSTTILPDVPAAYAIPGGQLYQPADYSGRFSGRCAFATRWRTRSTCRRCASSPIARRRHVCSTDCTSSASRISSTRGVLRSRTDAGQRRGEPLGTRAGLRNDRARRRPLPLHLLRAISRAQVARSAMRRRGRSSPTCSPIRTRARNRSACTRCSRCRFRPR